MLLVTRLVPSLREALSGTLVLRVPELEFTLPLLYHPGFWLVMTALVSVPLLRVGRGRLAAAAGGTLGQWLAATLAVAGFLCFSRIMFDSGMTLALAEAVAAATGRDYILLLPLVGGLGGFLTASNAGSNAMFAGFQEAMSARLDLPEDLVVAAQNAGRRQYHPGVAWARRPGRHGDRFSGQGGRVDASGPGPRGGRSGRPGRRALVLDRLASLRGLSSWHHTRRNSNGGTTWLVISSRG